MNNQMSVGDLVFFLACLNMLLQPIRMAGMMVMLLQRAVVATDRLFEIFDTEPEIEDSPTGETPKRIGGRLELRQVRFVYPGNEKWVLDKVSLKVEPGESLAIVGRIGSGKSTLLKLFTRIVDTPRGQVFIDGHDVCDYPLGQLRTDVAQVLQDAFLFGEPIHNNISYDDPERNLELIWDAAESAS